MTARRLHLQIACHPALASAATRWSADDWDEAELVVEPTKDPEVVLLNYSCYGGRAMREFLRHLAEDLAW